MMMFQSNVCMMMYVSVLYSYLSKNPEQRENLWACSYSGEEGYRKNIWLDLRRMKRIKKEEDDRRKLSERGE